MMTLTVICREAGYPDVLIYTVKVSNPTDRSEVEDAINFERQRDLGDADMGELEALFAFQGDIAPRADWRD